MIYVGIDPGVAGAVAVIDGEQVWLHDTPVVKADKGHDYLTASMVALLRDEKVCVAALERGIAMPLQASSSTFKAGRGQGLWEGILAGLGIPFELVYPAAWKRAMGVTSNKGEARVLAQRLFPQAAPQLALVKHDGRAEALLLACWLRRRNGGEP